VSDVRVRGDHPSWIHNKSFVLFIKASARFSRLHTRFTSNAITIHEVRAIDPSSSGIQEDMNLDASLALAVALADGLGPGGYAVIFWIILFIFVVGLLFVVGFVALVIWLILRRRNAGLR